MSSRSYLSIGDVLTLLRQEFPDVTISKIRFLESQGLVNPERTPSGYRKFYEHDVERLRWVLRQQRENFLPLKVIKDRLDDDARPWRGRTGSGGRSGGRRRGRGDRVARRVGPARAGPRRATLGTDRVRERHDGTHRPWNRARRFDLAGDRECRPSLAGESRRRAGAVRTLRRRRGGVGARSACRVGGSSGNPTTGDGGSGPDQASRVAPDSERTRHRGRRRGSISPRGRRADESGARRGATRARRHLGPSAGGVSLSLGELAAASGLDDDALRQLQEYGLLTATPVAGMDYFDQDALAVASAAAGLAQFGVEPRHLRLYKNAADREAGFVEQIVLPLVRQRNPDARAKAHQTAEELADLGQQLRTSLLRVALRSLLEG